MYGPEKYAGYGLEKTGGWRGVMCNCLGICAYGTGLSERRDIVFDTFHTSTDEIAKIPRLNQAGSTRSVTISTQHQDILETHPVCDP